MDRFLESGGAEPSLAALVPEADWQRLAPAAGGVGRFLYDTRSGLCELDATLRRMTGLLDHVAAAPAEEFLARIGPADRARVEAAIEATVRTRAPYDVEFPFRRPDGREIWMAGHGRMLDTADGRDLLIGVNFDVTERRRAQERAELLAGEMAHRLKNAFALVQGMLNLAARSADTKEALVEGFSGRLQALAAVNALTFAGDDRTVAAPDLVDAVLGPMIASGRVLSDVAPFALNGVAAQTVVLVLNELLTNAVKHGALRDDDDGHVGLRIGADERGFTLAWTETARRRVEAPVGRDGFGMRVLSSMTAATFEGRPVIEWSETGLRFTCWWPLKQFGVDNLRAHERDAILWRPHGVAG